MFWLVCRSFRAKGIAGRRQKSCVKNMGFTTCLFFLVVVGCFFFFSLLGETSSPAFTVHALKITELSM